MKPQRAGIVAVGAGMVCVVLAQAPSYTRPLGTAGNLFFASLVTVSAEDASLGIGKIREVTGVDDETAFRFLSALPDALEQMRNAAGPIESATCAQRAELTTIPLLADALTREDIQFERRRAQIVRESAAVLGDEAVRKLENWLTMRNGDQAYAPNNYVELLEKKGVTAQEHLVTKCDVRLGGRG